MKLRHIVLSFIAALSVACSVHATDIPITPTGPVFTLPGSLTWGVSGPTGINNNFFFVPLSQSGNVCVYVFNNNPSNGHPFVANIVVTANPAEKTPSDGSWSVISRSLNSFAASPPAGVPAGLGINISGVAQVSINISGSTTLGGNPDTANIVVIQSANGCFSGSNFSAAGQSVIAVPPIQFASDSLSQGYGGNALATNPGANAAVAGLLQNNNSVSAFLDTIIFDCSAACTVQIQMITSIGTTCTGLSSTSSLKSANSGGAFTLFATCAANPAVAFTTFVIDLPANSPFTFDAKGIILPAFTTNGVMISTNGFTGTIRTNFKWYEK